MQPSSLAEGVKTKNKFGREQVLHSTHLQFHSYGGEGWKDFCSKAKEVMDYVNKQKNITIDLGCVTLDETTTMTADGPFEHHLHGLNHLKWTNVDVEMETAAGIVPYIYDKNVLPNAIQWATGLELALFAKDMNRTFITTDHPNAGPFTRYPRVIKWLMSKKAREATLATMKNSDKVINATYIHGIDRELTLYEIAQMTLSARENALASATSTAVLHPAWTRTSVSSTSITRTCPKMPRRLKKHSSGQPASSKAAKLLSGMAKLSATATRRPSGSKSRCPRTRRSPVMSVRHSAREPIRSTSGTTRSGIPCTAPVCYRCRCGGLSAIMATVTLKPTKVPELIFEGYSINPDAFAKKKRCEIAALPGHEGKIHVTIRDFFEGPAMAADCRRHRHCDCR